MKWFGIGVAVASIAEFGRLHNGIQESDYVYTHGNKIKWFKYSLLPDSAVKAGQIGVIGSPFLQMRGKKS